jgi:hypothetical protein
MPILVWDQMEDRLFETGINKGVLYFPDGGGVAWNGLTSIDVESTTSLESVYYDGVKFNDIIIAGDFTASLRAFTYPDEFLEYEGIGEEQAGLYMADQPQKLFHMSYQTKTVDGHGNEWFKIHMLWNLTAVPSTRSYRTLSLEVEPSEFEWSITSVPEPVDNYRPTSHVIIDSRKMDEWLIEDIQTILYGGPGEDEIPTMPSLKGFISYIRKWDRMIITDHGDGTWSAETAREGYIVMVDETTFVINNANAEYLDPETYEISSSDKNEEDIS